MNSAPEAASARDGRRADSPRRRIGYGALGLGVLLLLGSCAAETRYRMLTVFFDGVPPPAKPGAVGSAETATSPSLALSPAGGRMGPRRAAGTGGSIHPPVAQNQCLACHDVNKGLEPKMAGASFCDECHGEQRRRERWDHGPINLRMCLPCHRFHDSPYPFLLDQPMPDLCLYCHGAPGQKGYRHVGVAAANDADCLRCHDGHHRG